MADLATTETDRVYTPLVDITAKGEEFVVHMDVPGADSEGIDIDLQDDLLKISAEVIEPDVEGLPLVHQEYPVGRYEATLKIRGGVDGENITAVMKDGVLTLTIPKAEQMKPKKISVHAA